MKIWVLSDHWCILAVEVSRDAQRTQIKEAAVIRRWGTNAGLGQLAREGLREETILDAQPDGEINNDAITFILDCDPIWTPEYIAAHYVAEAMN